MDYESCDGLYTIVFFNAPEKHWVIKRKRNNNDKKRQKIIFIFFNVIERFTNLNSSTLARVNLNLPKQCMFTPLTVKMNRNEESHPQWIKSSLDYIFIHILMLVKRVKIFCMHELESGFPI